MKLVEDTDEFTQPPRETNVVRLRIISSLPLNPDQLLEEAKDELDGVIILGWRKGDPENRNSGDEYFASSIADGATVRGCSNAPSVTCWQLPTRTGARATSSNPHNSGE